MTGLSGSACATERYSCRRMISGALMFPGPSIGLFLSVDLLRRRQQHSSLGHKRRVTRKGGRLETGAVGVDAGCGVRELQWETPRKRLMRKTLRQCVPKELPLLDGHIRILSDQSKRQRQCKKSAECLAGARCLLRLSMNPSSRTLFGATTGDFGGGHGMRPAMS